MGYATAAPAYTPGVYAGANQAFPSGECPRLSHIITAKQTSNRVIFLPKTKSKSSSMKRLFLNRFFSINVIDGKKSVHFSDCGKMKFDHGVTALTDVLVSPGYAPGTPFKMSCSPNTGTVPPFSSSPNPYPAAVYPVRSTYPQQNPYAQVRTLLTLELCLRV